MTFLGGFLIGVIVTLGVQFLAAYLVVKKVME